MPRKSAPSADYFQTPPSGDGPTIEFHLLGEIPFTRGWELQQRLAYDAGGRRDHRIDVILCEHPTTITVGRGGSWAQILAERAELARREIPVQWVSRGGGCLVHTPGQLAIYPIVPLDRCGWRLGDYLRRLQSALVNTVTQLQVAIRPDAGEFGVWGRGGELATMAVAVRHGVTQFGVYLNVAPALKLARMVQADPRHGGLFSSLLAERQGPVRMAAVRESFTRNFVAACRATRYHVHAGHPLIPVTSTTTPGSAHVG